MTLFEKIVTLSKKTAAAILKEERPIDLEQTDVFDQGEKDYVLKELTDESKFQERLRLAAQIDTKEDWEKVRQRIRISRPRPVWKYAAAASIVLLLGLGSYWYMEHKDPMGPAIVETEIKIGTDKATLTLEDGTEVALEKGTSYQSTNATSNGETIVYVSSRAQSRDEHQTPNTEQLAINTLTIPRGGQFVVELQDGTKVWLNSDTQLKYPVSFLPDRPRAVELVYGEAYFEVSPSHLHQGASFKVMNQGQEVEVLGTQFNIKAYREESHIYTTLVEGKVAVSNRAFRKELLPGQQAILDLGTNAFQVANADIYSETSWRNGMFSFKGKPLKEIMKVLERWYDVDFVFADPKLEEVKFNGVLSKKQELDNILNTIKNTEFIEAYEINQKTITIK